MHRRFILVLSMLAASTIASAAVNRVVAQKVDGVTLDQVKAATSPIAVAKYDVDGAHMGVRCAGSTGQLICEVWNIDRSEIVAASSELKIRRVGNDFALMGERAGPGREIILPNGLYVGDPTTSAVCAG